MPFLPLDEVRVPFKTQIGAKIVRDSLNVGNDIRLTTVEMVYPLFIHNELMTHRMFSRNAASSRAIPINKMIERVLTDTAMPVTWRENCKGMVPHLEVDPDVADCARYQWCLAAQDAAHHARKLEEMGLHKEIVNRVLAPFLWMTTLVTATDWNNFFHLRTAPTAQKEFQVLACAVADAYFKSNPTQLWPEEWHTPYLTQEDKEECQARYGLCCWDYSRLVSVGRCARVSYLTHEGSRDIDQDIRLARDLERNGHWSPFEHVAKAEQRPIRSGNFLGWTQFRKLFQGDNIAEFTWPRVEEAAL